MAGCKGCELLPEAVAPSGTLYISPPLGHTMSKYRSYFESHAIEVSEPASDILAVNLADCAAALVHPNFAKLTSDAELDDTRSLIVPHGMTPSLAELMRMKSLKETIARLQGEWLVEIIRQNRLITHFQPIVHSVDADQVYAYECLLRAVDEEGKPIYPDRLYTVARDARLLFHLDRAARLKHIRTAIEQGLQTNIFINFNPTSIYDPVFCLQSTVRAIRESGIPSERFVFEVVESDEIKDPDRLPMILDFYRRAGFRVALDDMGAGYGSLSLLTKLKPDVVKLDMQLIRNVDQDPYKAQIAAKLLELCCELGIETVAEGIETVGEWRWCTEHGATYVQGYLFAKPAATPPLREAQPSRESTAAVATL